MNIKNKKNIVEEVKKVLESYFYPVECTGNLLMINLRERIYIKCNEDEITITNERGTVNEKISTEESKKIFYFKLGLYVNESTEEIFRRNAQRQIAHQKQALNKIFGTDAYIDTDSITKGNIQGTLAELKVFKDVNIDDVKQAIKKK